MTSGDFYHFEALPSLISANSPVSLSIALFRNVSNSKELRKNIMEKGTLLGDEFDKQKHQIALLKAKLVASPLQASISAQKALISHIKCAMTTRTWSTEVIYNLSSSKNITESLKTFGIGDDDSELLVVALNATEDVEKEIVQRIHGDIAPLEDLEQITDWPKIRKVHKMKGDIHEEALKSLLISKSAAKDLSV